MKKFNTLVVLGLVSLASASYAAGPSATEANQSGSVDARVQRDTSITNAGPDRLDANSRTNVGIGTTSASADMVVTTTPSGNVTATPMERVDTRHRDSNF